MGASRYDNLEKQFTRDKCHTGISLPIIVPPIRESLGFGDVTVAPNPPRVKELIEMSKAK